MCLGNGECISKNLKEHLAVVLWSYIDGTAATARKKRVRPTELCRCTNLRIGRDEEEPLSSRRELRRT